MELDAAVTQELGVGLIEIVHFHHELINIGWELDGEPKTLLLEELSIRLAARLGWERDKVDRAIDLHSLRPRDNFFPAAPFSRTDVYPWRFNRELSYIRRPILIRVTETGAEEAVWGTRHVYSAGRHTFELFTGGRMRARTERLNVLLNRWRAADALAFNDQVADLFRTQEKSKVRVRVTRFGRRPIERARGHQISDIDVFVADTERQEILVIETKALAVGRTAAELENERLSTFVAAPGRRSDVEKLLDVVEWVEAHLAHVLASVDIDDDAAEWRIRPLFVVEAELLTPFITDVGVPVIALHELEDALSRGESPIPSPG